MNNKEKVALAIVIAAVAIGAAAYYFFIKPQKSQSPSGASNNSFYVDTNPLKDQPDVNPVDKSNPFRSVKTNPFE